VPDLAVAQPFGVPWGTRPLVVSPDPSAPPVLGDTLGVDLTGVGGAFAFLNLGWSHSSDPSGPLPFELGVAGLPGCWALTTVDGVYTCTPTGPGTARLDLTIPALPTLLGARWFQARARPCSPGALSQVGTGLAVPIGR